MKTTFKKVFNELNDEFISIKNFNVDENIDIDVEKIKREVFMRIDDKKQQKRLSKKFIAILVAAAIVILGTVGVFSAGSIQSVFREMFNNSSKNAAGLYDGGNIEIYTEDDSLNIELLGVTGDGDKLYSAIEVTKKDGSEVIDKDYKYPYWYVNDRPEQLPEDKTVDDYFACRAVCVDSNGNLSNDRDSGVKTMNSIKYSLSYDNKTLKIFVYSIISEGNLKDGRMTVSNEGFGAYKIFDIIYEVDYAGKSFDDFDDTEPFDEDIINRRMQELGITDDDCCATIHDGQKAMLCWCDTKKFDLPFEISFDLNYRTNDNINMELTVEKAPNVVQPTADNAKMTVTPFGIYLYGDYDKKLDEESSKSARATTFQQQCFKDVSWDDTSKVILNDGTVYYLYPYEGGNKNSVEGNNEDYYEVKYPLNYSTVVGAPIEPEINVIDIREIKTVIISGDVVYSK